MNQYINKIHRLCLLVIIRGTFDRFADELSICTHKICKTHNNKVAEMHRNLSQRMLHYAKNACSTHLKFSGSINANFSTDANAYSE